MRYHERKKDGVKEKERTSVLCVRVSSMESWKTGYLSWRKSFLPDQASRTQIVVTVRLSADSIIHADAHTRARAHLALKLSISCARATSPQEESQLTKRKPNSSYILRRRPCARDERRE